MIQILSLITEFALVPDQWTLLFQYWLLHIPARVATAATNQKICQSIVGMSSSFPHLCFDARFFLNYVMQGHQNDRPGPVMLSLSSTISYPLCTEIFQVLASINFHNTSTHL